MSALIDMPLATKLVVVEFEEITKAVRKDSVQIVLSGSSKAADPP